MLLHCFAPVLTTSKLFKNQAPCALIDIFPTVTYIKLQERLNMLNLQDIISSHSFFGLSCENGKFWASEMKQDTNRWIVAVSTT